MASKLAVEREAVVSEINDWVTNKLHNPDFWRKAHRQLEAGGYEDRVTESEAVKGCWSDMPRTPTNDHLRQVYQAARAQIKDICPEPYLEAGQQAIFAILALLCSVYSNGQYMRQTLDYWWTPLLIDHSIVDIAIRTRIAEFIEK